MNLTRLAIVLGALGGFAAATAQAQTQTFSRVRSATRLQAVPSSSPKCASCGAHVKTGYTQFARPYPGCSFAYKDTPYPKGPCCATIVGEFLCDIGYHIGCLFACKHDVLGVGYGDCCGDSDYCAEPIDCVPRFRDLGWGPRWGWGGRWGNPYPGSLWGSYQSWPQDDFGGYIESEGYGPQEADLAPASPPEASQAEEVPAGESPDPSNSTRLRSVLPPSAARPPGPFPRQSYRFAPARGRAIRTRAYGPTRAAYFGPSAPASIGKTRPPAPVRKPNRRSAARTPAPIGPISSGRPIQFGDQFGKNLRPGSRGARFP